MDSVQGVPGSNPEMDANFVFKLHVLFAFREETMSNNAPD